MHRREIWVVFLIACYLVLFISSLVAKDKRARLFIQWDI